MKITKSQLKQIIKEELENVLEVHDLGGEDPPTSGDIKFSGQYDQAFDEPLDPIEQLATGGQSTDEVLDVLKQLFDLVPPEDAQRFADEAQSLAQAVGGDEPPGGFSGEGAWKSREPNK